MMMGFLGGSVICLGGGKRELFKGEISFLRLFAVFFGVDNSRSVCKMELCIPDCLNRQRIKVFFFLGPGVQGRRLG